MNEPNKLRFVEVPKASWRSVADAANAQELEKQQEELTDGQHYDSWNEKVLKEDRFKSKSADTAYTEAMRARQISDFEEMKSSIYDGDPSRSKAASARGKHALYLADEIRKARKELVGVDVTSAEWRQLVSDREERLNDVLILEHGSLSEREINFIIDFSSGAYDDIMDDTTGRDPSVRDDSQKGGAQTNPNQAAPDASRGDNHEHTGDVPEGEVEQELHQLAEMVHRPSLTLEEMARIGEAIDDVLAGIGVSVEPIPLEDENDSDDVFVPIEPIDLDEEDDPDFPGSQEPEKERIDDIRKRWLEYMAEHHQEDLDSRERLRNDFLEIAARSQKGHLRRIKPDGYVAKALRSFFAAVGGNKAADFLTRPTEDERKAGQAYADALGKVDKARHNFMGHEHDNGRMSLEELQAERAMFFSSEYRSNALKIAELQKDAVKGKKPMNRWLRRLGYVGSGVAGGLVAMTPVGWIGGGLLAVGGAVALRVNANKRSAALKGKNIFDGGTHVVDGVAEGYARTYDASMKNRVDQLEDGEQEYYSANDLLRSHYDDISNEVGKNRDRITIPILATLGAMALTRIGVGELMNNSAKSDSTAVPDTATPDGFGDFQKDHNDPSAIISEPETSPPATPELVDINTNSAPERAVDDLLSNAGYRLEGDKTSFLTELADRLGSEDKMFVDGSGNAVDMYLGKDVGDPRYQVWNQDVGIRFSDEAVKFLDQIRGIVTK